LSIHKKSEIPKSRVKINASLKDKMRMSMLGRSPYINKHETLLKQLLFEKKNN